MHKPPKVLFQSEDMETDPPPATVTTGFAVEKRTCRWKIASFDAVRSNQEYINSQEARFKFHTSSGETEWKFFLFMLPEETLASGQNNWIGFGYQCTRWPTCRNQVTASFEILVGNKCFKSDTYTYAHKSNFWGEVRGWNQIFRKDAQLEELHLEGGDLVIDIVAHIYGPIYIASTEREKFEVPLQVTNKIIAKLQSDLKKLTYYYPPASEEIIKIVSGDKQEFLFPKSMLSVRSDMFEKLLGSEFIETKNGEIHVEELSGSTLQVILGYINNGEIQGEWSKKEVVVELTYAAGKYQLLELTEYLNHLLGDICCKETCGPLLSLTKKLGMQKAYARIQDWIQSYFGDSANDMVATFESMYRERCP